MLLAKSTNGDSLVWRANVAAAEVEKVVWGFTQTKLPWQSRTFCLRETVLRPANEIHLLQARTHNIPSTHNFQTIERTSLFLRIPFSPL